MQACMYAYISASETFYNFFKDMRYGFYVCLNIQSSSICFSILCTSKTCVVLCVYIFRARVFVSIILCKTCVVDFIVIWDGALWFWSVIKTIMTDCCGFYGLGCSEPKPLFHVCMFNGLSKLRRAQILRQVRAAKFRVFIVVSYGVCSQFMRNVETDRRWKRVATFPAGTRLMLSANQFDMAPKEFTECNLIAKL